METQLKSNSSAVPGVLPQTKFRLEGAKAVEKSQEIVYDMTKVSGRPSFHTRIS